MCVLKHWLSLREGLCSAAQVTECFWASTPSAWGKGSCILAVCTSFFSSLCQLWILHRSHLRFLLDHWETWGLTWTCSSGVVFLISQPWALASELRTGCLLSHCRDTVMHLESQTTEGAVPSLWHVRDILTFLPQEGHHILYPACSVPQNTQDIAIFSPHSPGGTFPGQCGTHPLIRLQQWHQTESNSQNYVLLSLCSLA